MNKIHVLQIPERDENREGSKKNTTDKNNVLEFQQMQYCKDCIHILDRTEYFRWSEYQRVTGEFLFCRANKKEAISDWTRLDLVTKEELITVIDIDWEADEFFKKDPRSQYEECNIVRMWDKRTCEDYKARIDDKTKKK